MAMVGWSRKSEERAEAHRRWWAKATPQEKINYRAEREREERFVFRRLLPALGLALVLIEVATYFGWLK